MITDDQHELLKDIINNTERPDKLSVRLNNECRTMILEYEDMDDEWFKEMLELTPNARHQHGKDLMKLTDKQRSALLDAKQRGGLFQLPERAKHSPAILSRLCKVGFLERMPVGVIWQLTPAGKAALDA